MVCCSQCWHAARGCGGVWVHGWGWQGCHLQPDRRGQWQSGGQATACPTLLWQATWPAHDHVQRRYPSCILLDKRKMWVYWFWESAFVNFSFPLVAPDLIWVTDKLLAWFFLSQHLTQKKQQESWWTSKKNGGRLKFFHCFKDLGECLVKISKKLIKGTYKTTYDFI